MAPTSCAFTMRTPHLDVLTTAPSRPPPHLGSSCSPPPIPHTTRAAQSLWDHIQIFQCLAAYDPGTGCSKQWG